MINWEKINRVVVVDHRASEGDARGVVIEAWNVRADYLVQDGERTLKVFITDREAPT